VFLSGFGLFEFVWTPLPRGSGVLVGFCFGEFAPLSCLAPRMVVCLLGYFVIFGWFLLLLVFVLFDVGAE
jgi:hypothetical protein